MEENVTEIAMSLGFNHMGRFVCEHRQRFGESPSATLKRPRRKHIDQLAALGAA